MIQGLETDCRGVVGRKVSVLCGSGCLPIADSVAPGMPFFSVLIEGNGLRIGAADEGPPIAGFFTSRVVWADSPAAAERIAMDGVAKEWSLEPYASQPGAQSLSLRSSESRPVGFIRGLVERPSGFTFFSAAS